MLNKFEAETLVKIRKAQAEKARTDKALDAANYVYGGGSDIGVYLKKAGWRVDLGKGGAS
jgi:hypothetical protein